MGILLHKGNLSAIFTQVFLCGVILFLTNKLLTYTMEHILGINSCNFHAVCSLTLGYSFTGA